MIPKGGIAGLVLAGGASRRMEGADKAFLKLGDETLVARAVRRLRPQVGEAIAISSNAPPEDFGKNDVPVLADIAGTRGHGPLAGVLAGLRWASSLERVTHLATVAVDTPFFPDDLVAQLGVIEERIAVAASGGRVHPTFALWPLSLEPVLTDHLREDGDRSVQRFFHAVGHDEIGFTVDGLGDDPFFNINRPEDAEIAVARLARGSEPA